MEPVTLLILVAWFLAPEKVQALSLQLTYQAPGTTLCYLATFGKGQPPKSVTSGRK